jgi:uncharacterized membrane protein
MAKLLTAIFTLIALSWTDILEVIADMHNTGASWGAIITAILLYNKLKNNKRRKEHDDTVEARQKAIMIHLEVPWDWDAEKRALQSSTAPMLFKWLHKGLYHAQGAALYTLRWVIGVLKLRRRRRMQNINWATLIPALFGAIKLILQPFGVDLSHITSEQVNAMANGVAALAVVAGIIYNHFAHKGGTTSGSDYSPGSNK